MPGMKQKVIVITGASSGIGEHVAIECAKRGARGVVLAARREAELARVAAQVTAHGATALTVVADVTRRADNERVIAEAVAKFGAIDAWIGNAGRGISKMPSQLDDADLDAMIATNLKSVIYGVQAALVPMRAAKRGHLIAVSSGLSRMPFAPQRAAYSAAKAGMNLYMASLRIELRAELPDVHVSTVLPGVVATEFGASALYGGVDSRKIPNAQPVGEVAALIADLIERPRAEVYTRPEMAALAARYFGAEDVGAIEAQPPFTTPPR